MASHSLPPTAIVVAVATAGSGVPGVVGAVGGVVPWSMVLASLRRTRTCGEDQRQE
jgi:hypothetical protein